MTGNPAGRPGGLSERSRGIASAVLVVIGAVLLLAGTIAFYGRTEIIDREAFADRAVEALENDGVRELVGQQIVVNLVDRGSTDLVAVRPLLESVVGAVIQTDPFRRLFRAAALQTNQVFFERERGNALFDLADATQVVRFGLKSVSPQVAKEIPQDLEPKLLTLRRREFAGTTLAVADDIRVLGLVLPLLAIVAFVAAVGLAPDRRLAVLRVGVGIGAAGAVLACVLFILRARTLAGVHGEDETTDEQVRDAVSGRSRRLRGGPLRLGPAARAGRPRGRRRGSRPRPRRRRGARDPAAPAAVRPPGDDARTRAAGRGGPGAGHPGGAQPHARSAGGRGDPRRVPRLLRNQRDPRAAAARRAPRQAPRRRRAGAGGPSRSRAWPRWPAWPCWRASWPSSPRTTEGSSSPRR